MVQQNERVLGRKETTERSSHELLLQTRKQMTDRFENVSRCADAVVATTKRKVAREQDEEHLDSRETKRYTM